MRIGIVGFDTSHAHVFPAYIRQIQEEDSRYGDIEIVSGWAGDPATALNPDGLEGTYQKVADLGIKRIDNLDELIDVSDGIMLESVNGDTHLELARKILPTGKPTFIDKPLANTVEHARAIIDLVKQTGTPCWSSSALRYSPAMLEAIEQAGTVVGIDVHGPAHYVPGGRDIVYYGIHTAEMMVTALGQGVRQVTTAAWHENNELIVAEWNDGRIATLRGQRNPAGTFGGMVHGTEGSFAFGKKGSHYEGLCRDLLEFFKTRTQPVILEESLEVIRLLDAAVRSREAGGTPMSPA